MNYSTTRRRDAKLMSLSSKCSYEFSTLDQLGDVLTAGDVVVVNDAATIPASIHMRHRSSGRLVELRLVSFLGEDPALPRKWRAISLGAGDWQTATEKRPRASLVVGDELSTGNDFLARIESISDPFVDLEFQGSNLWWHIYAAGRPIQYYYHREAFELWDAQTIFASHPVAIEPPSASMHLQWSQILALRARGVEVLALTHAAGISTLGSPEADRLLPLPERYWIPSDTARSINMARQRGSKVVAVGTSVVRALESAALRDGGVIAGQGVAELKLSKHYQRRVVDSLLTGMHDMDTSHMQLLAAFVGSDCLSTAYQAAEAKGFQWHEFGDLTLIHGSVKDTSPKAS